MIHILCDFCLRRCKGGTWTPKSLFFSIFWKLLANTSTSDFVIITCSQTFLLYMEWYLHDSPLLCHSQFCSFLLWAWDIFIQIHHPLTGQVRQVPTGQIRLGPIECRMWRNQKSSWSFTIDHSHHFIWTQHVGLHAWNSQIYPNNLQNTKRRKETKYLIQKKGLGANGSVYSASCPRKMRISCVRSHFVHGHQNNVSSLDDRLSYGLCCRLNVAWRTCPGP